MPQGQYCSMIVFKGRVVIALYTAGQEENSTTVT